MIQWDSIPSPHKMARMCHFPVAFVFLSLVITFSILSFSVSKSSGFSIRLIPGDSPESPLYPGKLTHCEKIERMANISITKAELMKLRSTQNATSFEDEKHFVALKR